MWVSKGDELPLVRNFFAMLYESHFVVLCISGYCNRGYKSLYALTFRNTVLN